VGQPHLDILRSASSHPDLRGGFFGKLSNLITFSALSGVVIGAFFYFGCTSGIGTTHVMNSAIFGGICMLMTAWILRSNAKAVQKDYIRMMRLKGIDQDILHALDGQGGELDKIKGRFRKAGSGTVKLKERDIYRVLNVLTSKT